VVFTIWHYLYWSSALYILTYLLKPLLFVIPSYAIIYGLYCCYKGIKNLPKLQISFSALPGNVSHGIGTCYINSSGQYGVCASRLYICMDLATDPIKQLSL
jgi:hypothetical protein